MTFGAPDRPPLPLGHVAIYLVGVAGLAVLHDPALAGHAGGHGPRRASAPPAGRTRSPWQCPDAVAATTPLSIFGGLLSVGLMLWGGAALGGAWMGLVFLAWPALFLSLGWNFLAYGLFPPDGGWVWSWIFCGVLFVLMGGIPLIGAIGVARDESDGSRAYASGRVVVRPRPVTPAAPRPIAEPRPDRHADDRRPGSSSPGEPLVDRLERLAALRRSGDLTNEEYETAKAATLAEARS